MATGAFGTLSPEGRTSPAVYRRWVMVAAAVLVAHWFLDRHLAGSVQHLLWYAVLIATYGLLWMQSIRRLRDAGEPLILHWTFLWGGFVIAIYVGLTRPSYEARWGD